jgi:protease II
MKDELVYEEKDELYRLGARRSRDKQYQFATSASFTTTEVRFLRSDRPTDGPHIVLPRENAHQYSLEHRDGRLFIRTNRSAKNFLLVRQASIVSNRCYSLLIDRASSAKSIAIRMGRSGQKRTCL